MVTEAWQQLMKFLQGISDSEIHYIHVTTTLANHITNTTKLCSLLKLDIRKLQVFLCCYRGLKELVNAVLTYKIGIFLERTCYVGTFVMYPFITLCAKAILAIQIDTEQILAQMPRQIAKLLVCVDKILLRQKNFSFLKKLAIFHFFTTF